MDTSTTQSPDSLGSPSSSAWANWLEGNCRYGTWEEQHAFAESQGFSLAPKTQEVPHWMDEFRGMACAKLYVVRDVGVINELALGCGGSVLRLGYPVYLKQNTQMELRGPRADADESQPSE